MRPIRLVIPIFLISAAALLHQQVLVPAQPAHDGSVVASNDIPPETAPPPPAPSPPMPTGAELQRLIQRAEADGYAVHSHDGTFTASNGRHGISAQWSADGRLQLESLDPKIAWHFAMKSPGTTLAARAADGRLTFERPAMDEWFVNDARGLEHGFHVPSPPTRPGDDGFRVAMEITTSLQPVLHHDRRAISFNGQDGDAALHYHGLLAFDATGRTLPAAMELEPAGNAWELAFHVDDRDAIYPLVIDPVFTTRGSTPVSNPQVEGELFGAAVSLSGGLLAVGIPHADGPEAGQTDIGAVDLFRYHDNLKTWIFVKRLHPGSPVGAARFGSALELDGDSLIVGAPGEAIAASDSGAAYVFQRDTGGLDHWGQVAKLVPTDGAELASFGASVAIDGGIAAIGAPQQPTGGVLNRGAVYASFRTPAGAWSLPVSLGGFVPAENDFYGRAVDVCGSRIAVSALFGESISTPPDAGVVVIHDFTLIDDGAPLGKTTTLVTDLNPESQAMFGAALSLEGNTLVVGSSNKLTGTGTAAVFRHDTMAGWLWLEELRAPDGEAGDRFGSAVGLSGNTLAIGAPWHHDGTYLDAGATYLFERPAGSVGSWIHVEKRLRVQKESDSRYGHAVAVSGDAIAVGVPYDDGNGGLDDSGLVETLDRRSAAWLAVQAPLLTNNPASELGHAVAIDRDRAAIGQPERVVAGESRGAVVLRTANIGNDRAWGLEILLESPTPQADERFGHSVAVAGDWLLVGAPGHDDGGLADAGRAYLFRRTNGVGWSHYLTFDPPILTAGAEFGSAVALDSRWAFVGAPGMSHGFVFDRYEGGTDVWDISTILDESAAGGRFGAAVTLDGDFAAFSAPQRDGIAPPAEGSAPVPGAGQVKIYRSTYLGGHVVWQAVKTLPQPNPDGSIGTAGGAFGHGLSLRHGLLLAGEPGHLADTGRVRVFDLNEGGANAWGERQTLTAPAAAPGDLFGSAVACGERWFFASAPGKREGGVPTGVIFTYDRAELDEPAQQPESKLLHPQGREGNRFGAALACGGGELIAGAPGAPNTSGSANSGGYAVFHRQSSGWSPLGTAVGANAGTGDQLGRAVAVDGEFLVAGAPFDATSGLIDAGSVHLYRKDPAAANGWVFVKLITAADPQVGADFGSAVDLHGDTLVVGAPGWDGRGAAYVFHRNNGSADAWGQQKRIDLFTVGAGDDFGAAVAVHGELIAVGSPSDNLLGLTDAGTVRVFGRHSLGNSNWGFLEEIQEPAPAAFDFFGSTVDVSDGRILIGAPLADDRGNASGNAYVFGRITGSNDWVQLDDLAPNDGQANDRLGGSVGIDGPNCVAGAIGESTHGVGAGAAWVFRDSGGDGTNWNIDKTIKVGDFENPVVLANHNFGSAVAIRGDRVTVGAAGHDEGAFFNCGAVYVFERTTTHSRAWGLEKKLTAAGAGSGARMGSAVAMSDGFIVAGAPESDQGAQTDAGNLFFFSDIGHAYRDWALARFGSTIVNTPPLENTVWGPEADADGDGRANAIEAFMDTDPAAADAGQLTAVARDADGSLVLRYRMGKETHGAVGRATWSREMTEWRGGEHGVDEFEIVTRVYRDEADHFIMEARVSGVQLVGEPRLFLRLEVHVP